MPGLRLSIKFVVYLTIFAFRVRCVMIRSSISCCYKPCHLDVNLACGGRDGAKLPSSESPANWPIHTSPGISTAVNELGCSFCDSLDPQPPPPGAHQYPKGGPPPKITAPELISLIGFMTRRLGLFENMKCVCYYSFISSNNL